jgi:hypothetical protein
LALEEKRLGDQSLSMAFGAHREPYRKRREARF